ncbi:5608_t:CDS:2 [Ambispora gerdemannii]|uniref:5608_t:CDS:1 n=1 Tax=Ambispora gerdemannii TaxID=144530 RepID=A0A9N8ZHT9_9GLOM|nr:5608_t:CDS:2 [Ambispora gerdemannii]
MQGNIDATKIKLQKAINNHDSDNQKIEECLELLDDLKEYDKKQTSSGWKTNHKRQVIS